MIIADTASVRSRSLAFTSPERRRQEQHSAFVALALFMASAEFSSLSAQQAALEFDGVNDYVTMGTATNLGSTAFTLECWFMRSGTGTYTTTGTAGIPDAVPLLAKGRAENETSVTNMNYILAIDSSNQVMAADFEDAATGLNHPVYGVTPLVTGVWYHAAATYDGTTWRLYLNGVLETSLVVNATPRGDSIQHASIGSALNSAGAPLGFFAGRIDEARIWNYARTATQVASQHIAEIASAPGLLGRWGFNEGAGTTASNSAATGGQGTLVNSPTWTTGYRFEAGSGGLLFDGLNDYVTFGPTNLLGLATFTLECWFKRKGAGIATTTGLGGVTNAIPLIAKGRGEADAGSNLDLNYILGIRASDGVLFADFEEGAGGSTPSTNHPVIGVTPIPMELWQHAAATYDGTTWRLYLNGSLEGEVLVGQPPRSDSIQHASLGSALTSSGAAAGFLDGILDEVRIWNYARSLSQITNALGIEMTTAEPGLVARWALNEGSGTVATNSVSLSAPGTLVNGPTWSTGSTFQVSTPPSPPSVTITNPLSGATFTSPASFPVQAVASDADGVVTSVQFKIDGAVLGVDTSAPYSVNTTNLGVGSYSLIAVAYDDEGFSRTSVVISVQVGPATGNGGLYFDGVNDYVTFGPTSALGVSTFTLETWFRRDGAGVGANTGSGGINGAIPLLAKGRGEQDGSNVDMNYILGIRASDGVLVADFEDAATGQNHPVVGVTPVTQGVWYHAAATYDGTTWRLYLNGSLEATLAVGQTPRADSIQHASLGSALNSSGTPEGYLHGTLDEVRLWNYARTQQEILDALGGEIAAQPGLVARWSLNEIGGVIASNSSASSVGGTLINGPVWTEGAPFEINRPPAVPTVVAPTNGAASVSTNASLLVAVSDPETNALTVTFYGRPVNTSPAGADFTVVVLPDTQYYTSGKNGGTVDTFIAQTEWALSNRVSRNIAFVTHLGDCVDDGDGVVQAWLNATNALYRLEDPAKSGLPEGMPWGMAVGNHDQSPNGDPDGTTTNYNKYFGVDHFSGRSYYATHYGTNNDNHVELFSASGLDFVAVHLEYDTSPDAAVLSWANGILQTYSNRRAIVISHHVAGTGNPAAFSTQGQAIYNALRTNDNLFLLLGGHVPGEGRRSDTFAGRKVDTLISDYQTRTAGGNGWLRILTFSPSNGTIRVQTYSPTLGQFETDADSDFSVTYAMQTGLVGFVAIATSSVPSGGTALAGWAGLLPGTQYEWYVTVSDGSYQISSVTSRFTTGTASVPDADGDGMDDAWELQFFATTTNGALGDVDGDGAPNIHEFIARTDPTNGASLFELTKVAMAIPPGLRQITASTSPGRKYTIFFMNGSYADTNAWFAFANSLNGIGTWIETNPTETVHAFVDDEGPNTTLAPPPAGIRTYRILVGPP